jgi:tetrapyrrole methylase family protein/MazG family protein
MAGGGRVVVVGLGPGGADLLVPAARAALDTAPRRFVRTAHHPAVADLAAAGVLFESFDGRYDTADDLEEVYRSIVATLVDEAAVHGEVAYAVPGNPGVAERSVVLLHAAAAAGQLHLRVVPGLSFADLAWARLGVDPTTMLARVVDGRALESAALDLGGVLVVAQCDDRLVLGDAKLALLDHADPDTPVTVLHHLGLPDETVHDVALGALDHVEPDHLTTFALTLPDPAPGAELARLLELSRVLRRPGGCPWDAEQTHHSLTRYLLEESYEVVDAVELLPAAAPDATDADNPAYAGLVDELGDLLYQVVFHVILAEEAGAFGLGDVARGVHDKLVRRHPHVFGDVDADTSADVRRNWEQIKQGERGSDSIMDSITPGLPSLLYAHKLLRKAASVGVDPGDVTASLDRVDAASAQLRDGHDDEAALGELLAATVALARARGVDTESALRGWSTRFRARFEQLERQAAADGVDLRALDPGAVAARWDASGDPAPAPHSGPT